MDMAGQARLSHAGMGTNIKQNVYECIYWHMDDTWLECWPYDRETFLQISPWFIYQGDDFLMLLVWGDHSRI